MNLFFFNSFLPPRVHASTSKASDHDHPARRTNPWPMTAAPRIELSSEISLNQGLLYASWFLSTGILGTRVPESLVVRYMAPTVSSARVKGFGAGNVSNRRKGSGRIALVATLRGLGRDLSRASVVRFAHAATFLPRSFYDAAYRSSIEEEEGEDAVGDDKGGSGKVNGETTSGSPWRWFLLLEGVVGPWRADSFLQQARLAAMDTQTRSFLKSGEVVLSPLVAPSPLYTELSSIRKKAGAKSGHPKALQISRALVACGNGDTLLSDLSQPLLDALPEEAVSWYGGRVAWIDGAGHYPIVSLSVKTHHHAHLVSVFLIGLCKGGEAGRGGFFVGLGRRFGGMRGPKRLEVND
jgi:hypothetical protein